MIVRLTVSIFLLCFLPLRCLSQEDKVQLQFVSFPKLASADPVELLIGEGETIKVELPTNRLSPVYSVNRLGKWALGKSSTDEEGNFKFETYGSAVSLAAERQLILVIRKGALDSDGFKLIMMDNGRKKFGGGMYFFMNASKVDVAVKLGNEQLALKPRAYKLVKPTPSKVKDNRKYLYVLVHYRRGNEAIPFYTSTWRYSDRARCMVFLYHDPHTNQLRTHTIRNYLE